MHFKDHWRGADLTGLDTANFVSESLFPVLSDAKEPPNFLNKMIQAGHLGIKSGKGFYPYDGNAGKEKVWKRDEQFRINQIKNINIRREKWEE